ncbi:MAG TPA: DNA polymerase III subunit [Verrucomicrobiae bacterium]|nr:DNA polymerase III subunit [Verrucomicrobiae bacterium]
MAFTVQYDPGRGILRGIFPFFQPPLSILILAVSFKEFSSHPGVALLQRSLARGRLGHAYLFSGDKIEELESIARSLAKTLNCQKPVKEHGEAVDCCDICPSCVKINNDVHADIHWVRPESRSRVVTIDQVRELMREIQLKPAEARFKVAVLVCADRLNVQAANAFLKTLEEPPAKSVMVLLSTEPSRILETILSRCLRVNFSGGARRDLTGAETAWLEKFGSIAIDQKTLLGRYHLADMLVQKLGEIRTQAEETLGARSPLQKYDDVEKDLREKWEEELAAAVEAEYRRRRVDLLLLVQCWLRDVWLATLAARKDLLNFPQLAGTRALAAKISSSEALENLETLEETQRLLHTNVQEALALEVGLLKLHF